MAEYRLLIKPSAAKEIDAIGSKRDRDALLLELRRSQGNLGPWVVRSLQVPRVGIVFDKATTVWYTL